MNDSEYSSLLMMKSLVPLSAHKALGTVAALVDAGRDRTDPNAADLAIRLGNGLLETPNHEVQEVQKRSLLHYYMANACAVKEELTSTQAERAAAWNAESSERQVLHLRTALLEGGSHLDVSQRARASTNLANTLLVVGRYVDALEEYERACSLAGDDGMAAANRGAARRVYARCVPDEGHARILRHHAAESLEYGLARSLDDDRTRAHFGAMLVATREALRGWRPPDDSRPEIVHDGEREYRAWALRERLFLNPLNDIGGLPLAARDPFSLMSMTTAVGERPTLFAFVNAIKQEYVSARFMLYRGTTRSGVHYSDRDVTIVNTLDYPSHRLGTEEVKSALRGAYSILDKIAVFVNAYFGLTQELHKVHFRTVWYENPKAKKKTLHPRLLSLQNESLRGLFWISKDIFDSDDLVVLDPDARALDGLRNFLEHRHVQVVDQGEDDDFAARLKTEFSVTVTRRSLERRTLRLLKIVRASIINLVCAVAAEEHQRSARRTDRAPAMPLGNLDDDWKQ